MQSFFLAIALGVILNWFAWMRGFYKAPGMRELYTTEISTKALIGVFAIYFFCTLILSRLLASAFYSSLVYNPIETMNWIQVFTTLVCALLLFFFSRAFIERFSLIKIWKDRAFAHKKSIKYDFLLGIAVYFLAFPIVMVVGELCDLLIYHLFSVENYEQVAVLYLKMTKDHPYLIYIALLVILVAAPCIEEYLFRGILQSWLRRKVGPKAAILLASLGFALFHMAPSQGWGNLTILASLFTFACFLGFLYEKQRSLFASIALHFAFNAVTTVRILFEVG